MFHVEQFYSVELLKTYIMLMTNIKKAVIKEIAVKVATTNGDGCIHLNKIYTFKTDGGVLKINEFDPETFSLDKLLALAKTLS